MSQPTNPLDQIGYEHRLLRALIDLLPETIFIKDLEGRILINNLADARTMGKLPSDVIGKSDFELYPLDLAEQYYADDIRVITTGESLLNREEQVTDEEGHRHWYSTSKYPLKDEHGQIIGLVGIGTNIDDRKKIEEEAKQSEKRYRDMARNLPNTALLLLDTDLRYIIAEGPELERTGYKQLELEGKTVYEVIQPEFIETYVAPMRAALAGLSSTQSYDFRDQSYVTTYSPLRAEDNTITNVLIFTRNVTAQRRAEKMLEEERQLLQTLIESIPDYIFAKDSEARFTLTNSYHMYSLPNTQPVDVIGKNSLELYPEPFNRQFYEDDMRVIRTGKPLLNVERVTLDQNGNERWVLSSKVPLKDSAGAVQGLVGISRDITDQRAAEMRLKQLQHEQQIILDNISSLVWYITPEGIVIRANQAAAQAVGTTVLELQGRSVYDIYPHSVEKFKSENEEIIRTKAPLRGLTGWSDTLTTGEAAFLIDKFPYLDAQGNVAGIIIIGTEVTELIKKEHALRQQREEQQIILDAVDSSIWLVDLDSRIIAANRATTVDLQVDHASLIGQKLTDLFPAAASAIRAEMDEMIRTGARIVSMAVREEHDGKSYLVSKSPYRSSEDGSIKGAVIVGTDVTMIRQAEAALRESEARYRLLAQHIPDSIVAIFDRDLRFVLVEGSATQAPTTEPILIIDQRPTECLKPPYGEQFEQLMTKTLQGTSETIQYQLASNGQYFEAAFIPLVDTEGNITDGLLVNRNITEQKRAEIALKERLDRIDFMRKTAATFVNVAFDAFDGEVVDALKIVTEFANVERGYVFLLTADEQHLELAYEWCQDGIIGHKGILDRVAVADFVDFVASMKRGEIAKVQAADIPRTRENEAMNHVLGLLEIKSFINVPILADEVFMGWIGFDATLQATYWSDDIVDLFNFTGQIIGGALSRKRSNESLSQLNQELERRVMERTQQLSATNRELESFAYSVSHDLRAPLRAIDGFSQALLEDYTDKLDDEGQDYLKRVRDGTQRMGKLIDAMLQLSRLTRRDLYRVSVNLSQIATLVTQELRQTNPERRVDFVVQSGVTAHADPTLIRVVLDNLLGNAWKYTSRHDQARIEFGYTVQDGQTAYFVRDDGAGFDPAYSERLFGAFQRLHHAHEFEGVGIGLATVMRIISRHGGTIWAESAVEKGATFWFTLPEFPPGKPVTTGP